MISSLVVSGPPCCVHNLISTCHGELSCNTTPEDALSMMSVWSKPTRCIGIPTYPVPPLATRRMAHVCRAPMYGSDVCFILQIFDQLPPLPQRMVSKKPQRLSSSPEYLLTSLLPARQYNFRNIPLFFLSTQSGMSNTLQA